MLRRLKNLWAWSALSPYEAGQETGNTIAAALKEVIASPPRAEIVYPLEEQPKTAIEGPQDLEAELQAISEEGNV